MKISTGNSRRAGDDRQDQVHAVGVDADADRALSPLQLLGGTVLDGGDLLGAGQLPHDSSAGVWPTTMISSVSGAGSAAAPMVPTRCPG